MTKIDRSNWIKIFNKYKGIRYHITSYASTSPDEDFAETFMYIYLNKDFKYENKIVKAKKQFILYLINKTYENNKPRTK